MAGEGLIRELLIKLGIVGQAETKTALADTAVSMDGVTAAAERTTAALKGQAAAAADTETILETKARIAQQAANQELDAEAALQEAVIAARLRMQELGEATVVGGKAMTAALLEARNAVAQLEVAMAAAAAAGSANSAVTQTVTAELAAYNQQIAGLSTVLEKGTSQQKIFGAEASIMRGNVAGAGSAIAKMGGDLASAILPLGVLLVAMDLLPRLLEGADNKTKAWSASLVDLVNGLHEEDAATKKSNESQQAYEDRVQKILNLKAEYVNATVAMVGGLINEEADVKKAVAAWEGYKASQSGVFEQYPAFLAALKAMGVTFKATHEDMAAQAQAFGQAYQTVLKRDGVQGAEAWADANKAVLERIVNYFHDAGLKIPAALADIAQALDSHVKKVQEEANSFSAINAALDIGTTKYGSHRQAVAALLPQIDALIADIEKQAASGVPLLDGQKLMLDSLVAWRSEIVGNTNPALQKNIDLIDARAKAGAELYKKLLDEQAGYDKAAVAIEHHQKVAVASAESTKNAVVASLDQQIAALDQNEMGHEAYAAKIAQLQNAEVDAKRKAVKEEDAANAAAESSLGDLAKAHKEKTTEIELSLAKLHIPLGDAKKDYDAVQLSVKDTVEQWDAEARAHRDVAEPIRGHNTLLELHHREHTEKLHISIPATTGHVDELGKKFKSVATNDIPAINGAIDGLIVKADALVAALGRVASASTGAFDSGGSAPVGDVSSAFASRNTA